MTEFLIGTAGTGKSELVNERIVSDLLEGKRVILLVPEQAALSSEERICRIAEEKNAPQSELEVLNFRRLANRVFREYGGISYNAVTGGAKAVLLWKALLSVSPYLTHYQNELDHAVRFVPALLSALSELKTAGITPEDMEEAIRQTEEEAPLLSSKLRDLMMIRMRYEEELNRDYSDPSDDLRRLGEILEKEDFFAGVHVYLDSFVGFTPDEFRIIRSVMKQSAQTVITLCMSTDREDHAFENIRLTLKTLKELAARDGAAVKETVLDRTYRYHSDALAFCERNLRRLGGSEAYAGTDESVRCVIADGRYAEAEFIACDIRKKLRSGCRYRDFAVIARQSDSYLGILDAVLAGHDIPCHLSRRIPLGETALFRLILFAFAVRNDHWRIEDIICYLKSGLTEVSPEECDELEEYIYKWNLSGDRFAKGKEWTYNPDGYTDVKTEKTEEKLARLNGIRQKVLRPLSGLFAALDGSATVREISLAVYQFLTGTGVDRLLAARGEEEIRIWNCFGKSLDTLCRLLPDHRVDARQFANLLSLVVGQTDVGNLPTTADEVAVGSADRIRAENVRHVYIVGVNEGEFPAGSRQVSLLSENDRALLETYDFRLTPKEASYSIDELYWFYRAAGAPKESLTVLCSGVGVGSDNGKPSLAFRRIEALFPENRVIRTASLPSDEKIQDKKASFSLLPTLAGTPEGEALHRLFLSDSDYAPLLADGRQKMYTVTETLEKETAEKLFRGDLKLPYSKLEQYASCAFGFGSKYILKLRDNDPYVLSPKDTGILVHEILERFFSGITDEDGNVSFPGEEEIDRRIESLIEDYLSRIFGFRAGDLLTPRIRQLFSRLKRNVKLLITNLLQEFGVSKFQPKYFELKIDNTGERNAVAPVRIPLSDGSHILINGTADRVDILKKGEDTYVRIIDYKTGHKDFKTEDLEKGLNLQLFLYLLSVCQDGGGKIRRETGTVGNILPAGVLYCPATPRGGTLPYGADRKTVDEAVCASLCRTGVLLDDEEINPELGGKNASVKTVKTVKNGRCSEEQLKKLQDTVVAAAQRLAEEMKRGKADAVCINDGETCLYCKFKPFCRNPDALAQRKEN